MSSALLRPITNDEIAMFHRDGAVLLEAVLSPDWVDLVLDGLEEAISEPDAMSTSLGRLRVDQFPAARAPSLRRMVEESPLSEIVGTVLGSPVRFYMDQLFAKPAGFIEPTAWHQDTCYYNVDGEDLIRSWVSPDVVDREVSLEVVRGSHRWNTTYAPLAGRDTQSDPEALAAYESGSDAAPALDASAYENWTYFSGVRDRTLPPVPDIESHRESFEILGWDYRPGDVLLFHGNCLHSARGGVDSERPRRAHASLWAGGDVRYLHRRGQIIPDPIALYEHNPTTGQLLSEFPDVFPTLWSPEPAV